MTVAGLARRLLARGMGSPAQFFFVKAVSRLGRSVQSGPWSAGSIRKKALSYQLAGFSDVLIVELPGSIELSLSRFLSEHPIGRGGRRASAIVSK